jgi:SAM-dependent methyltransferase
VVDHAYSDTYLAALYDVLNPWGPSDDFYLRLVMSADSALDVGCGTGALLHEARKAGHTGRLCGLDPAGGMLDRARKRSDIEWCLGDLASAAWEHEFDLVVMTGHAFQVLVSDDELRASLAAIRSTLTTTNVRRSTPCSSRRPPRATPPRARRPTTRRPAPQPRPRTGRTSRPSASPVFRTWDGRTTVTAAEVLLRYKGQETVERLYSVVKVLLAVAPMFLKTPGHAASPSIRAR